MINTRRKKQQIQRYLGHSNMSTTADIYSHLDANAKSEAGRAIESVLSINTEDTKQHIPKNSTEILSKF